MTKLHYKGYRAAVDYVSGELVVRVLGAGEPLEARCIRPSAVGPAFHKLIDAYLRRQSTANAQDAARLAAA